MSYQYTGCGLPYIYLDNGYVVEETPYGKAVAIENLPGLHKTIGKYLAERPGLLSGDEFRFLRSELDLSQKKFGVLFGITDQTVANWEKGNTELPQWADVNIRMMYLERIKDRNKNLTTLLEFLNEIDAQEIRDLVLKENGEEWFIAKSAA